MVRGYTWYRWKILLPNCRYCREFWWEIVKFMTDLIYIKWDLGDNPATKNRELVEAITCGVQLLTELADYTVEHHNTPPTSTQNVGSSSDGNQASMLEYAGVGAPVLDPLSPASSAPTTVTLRMKLGLVVGIVTNVVLGSWAEWITLCLGHASTIFPISFFPALLASFKSKPPPGKPSPPSPAS
ncbi:hypothetical protein BC829DRAFT_123039 [Chytridium lagenaria]|nr:hypothetical protein BC829DRAFT_123039 [Chytridium lagenaria]